MSDRGASIHPPRGGSPLGSTLSFQQLEERIAPLLVLVSESTPTGPPLDGIFDKIARLLHHHGKPAWACRPRIYAVLRMIDCPTAMDDFVAKGFFDCELPLKTRRLPRSLDTASQERFIQVQSLVLGRTEMTELERGKHVWFRDSADSQFLYIKYLGAGRFGSVDHVLSKSSKREYARKTVPRARSFGYKERIKAYRNELKSLKRLEHHHLVKLAGSYSDAKYIGLLTTPVADCDLDMFLKRVPFPDSDRSLIRSFFGCICSAIEYLHQEKCRHKDLKPHNILVHEKNILITDFGTAFNWNDQTHSTTTGYAGSFTPRYAAPEVLDRDRRNSSSDIWSLGCVYLEILTIVKGRSLEDMRGFFLCHGKGMETFSRNLPALAKWLDDLKTTETDNRPISWIQKMLLENPNDRITASELLECIRSDDGDHIYYGECCSGVEDLSISSANSDGTASNGRKSDHSATDRLGIDGMAGTLSEQSLTDALIGYIQSARQYLDTMDLHHCEHPGQSWHFASGNTLSRTIWLKSLCRTPWKPEDYTLEIFGTKFDVFSFGIWLCERTLTLQDSEHYLAFIRTFWVSLLLLELTIATQYECLNDASESSNADLDSIHRGIRECDKLWKSTEDILKWCETHANGQLYPNHPDSSCHRYLNGRASLDIHAFVEKLLDLEMELEPLLTLMSLIYNHQIQTRQPMDDMSSLASHIWMILFPPDQDVTDTPDSVGLCEQPPASPLPQTNRLRSTALSRRYTTYDERSCDSAISDWKPPQLDEYHRHATRKHHSRSNRRAKSYSNPGNGYASRSPHSSRHRSQTMALSELHQVQDESLGYYFEGADYLSEYDPEDSGSTLRAGRRKKKKRKRDYISSFLGSSRTISFFSAATILLRVAAAA